MFKVPECYRVKSGRLGSDISYGNNGLFLIDKLRCIASDGADWEHVSVSLEDRPPRWNEMCKVKDIFWDDEDLVVQFHPVKSDYVNYHPYCLHLWRKSGTNNFVEMPHHLLVGPKK